MENITSGERIGVTYGNFFIALTFKVLTIFFFFHNFFLFTKFLNCLYILEGYRILCF